MKEIPILFSTDMVQAILDGRKTQTRRLKGLENISENASFDRMGYIDGLPNRYAAGFRVGAMLRLIKCPYGKPGDLLWVREKFEVETDGTVKFYAGNIEVENNLAYRQLTKWKPSIHMPKAAARIWLQVESVHTERFGNITLQDIENEGLPKDFLKYNYTSPIDWFASLWESINGPGSWQQNPWVWVIKFKTLSTTGKPNLEF